MKISGLLQQYENVAAHKRLAFLHSEREKVTSKLLGSDSLNFSRYLHRAAIHYSLDYLDLAAGDAYRALTLLETYFDPDFSDFDPHVQNEGGEIVPWPHDEQAASDARGDMAECLQLIVIVLNDLGSLRDAHNYLVKLQELDKEWLILTEAEHQRLHDQILESQRPKTINAERRFDVFKEKIERARPRNPGFARREIYAWNKHEPDRSAPQTLNALNVSLKSVAPNLQVRSVELPVLSNSRKTEHCPSGAGVISSTAQSPHLDRPSPSVQLGLFAKVDLKASSQILNEASILAAVRPLDASLCHNCGASLCDALPASSSDGPLCCPSCADAAVFCSRTCLNIAQSKYHGTTCGNEDVDPLGRDENSDHPSEDLHFLILARAFAMSHAQNTHPLDLPETKYLWGEFTQPSHPGEKAPRTTLPFTFQHNIILPFRLLSILSEHHPDMSPFSPRGLEWYDTWVVQTLYAKFRGVASARQSSWDGRPEVAAVHPLWCLANHSCSPNVGWGWARERIFHVREKPVLWGNREEGPSKVGWQGIRAGEEILSHYCDVSLPVKDRREYMSGPLGGDCMCGRCVWETEKV